MTEFDKELRKKLLNYKVEADKKLYEIAEDVGIKKGEIYQFNAGNRSLKGESVKKLMDYLKLTVELKPKKQ